jgi:histidinol dehydrogenase
MMRIEKLTRAIVEKLLRSRSQRDRQAERVAARIITDVRRRGDRALVEWTMRLDHTNIRGGKMWIRPREFGAASGSINASFARAIRHAACNIRRVAEKQMPRPWTLKVEPGVRISQIVRPIESIGCYIPGGRFSLVSTLLMTVIPAQVAGVRRIVIVCPKPSPELFIAAKFLGVDAIAQIGGAQAIAALAYGTRSIPRVDKIFGPGNRYVAAAKQLVSPDCAIDLNAGPTEAAILAERGNPRWIAADLLAQAEHAPDAGSFLVTTKPSLARAVQQEIATQLAALPPSNPAHRSIVKSSAILLAPSLNAAVDFVNRFAPEHLSLFNSEREILRRISSAGTIFLGPWSAQPLGDYSSGSNHVLPTAAWAHTRGGLSTADFVKCINVQSISSAGFARLAPAAQSLACAEGLAAHENAVEVRR